ncbi:DUF4832 domain-containing protein [Reichenbachiella sp. 5M10]|uniref:DUF4832 domain-containing protein n=1 Tax=Reichenbachiella sp. 5M10 TaxID=1889772 RepID=UPI00130451D6|nr:DUF4832 domain-containing protein [Reichenbachiella sp. 5M10]
MQKGLITLFITSIISTFTSLGQSVTYESHDLIIPNPERGFYHHTEVHTGGNYNFLDLETLSSYQSNESITQILRVIYLEEFRNSPISNEYLNNIRKDLSTVRSAGLKCIIRFAYSTGTSAPYNDATPEIVQTHIEQIKPILRENADVIAVMQAGFIGTWGEWYYTDHFATSPGVINEDSWNDRKEVVFGLLDALTPDRMLQIRTPGYKMKIFDSEEAIDESIAFENTYRSRLGHHNDCFVASSSDFGTYINPDLEKPYLNQETLYTPMGGETCALASPYSDCDNSSNELARFHWSYINRDYNADVLNEWDNQGCFDEITLKIGYRHELLAGTYTESVQPGGTFSFDLDLQNTGYANPYNPRDIEIILRNQDSKEEYVIEPDTDIRTWPLGENINLSLSAGIPNEMTEGNYDLLLNLPDPYETLHNDPRYSIQMANTGVWEAETGYNKLNHTVIISADASQPNYDGDLEFAIAGLTESIDTNGEILGSASSSDLMIYWGRESSGLKRIIQRAENSGEYTTVATLPADQDYYLDPNISPETSYTYRYYLLSGDQISAYSEEVSLATNDINSYSINIDGNKEDWGTLPILSSASNTGQSFSMRTYFDIQNLYILIEGAVTNYKTYINTDYDQNTGYQEENSPLQGADYYLSGQTLYEFVGSEWQETEAVINSATQGNILELSLSQKELKDIEAQTSIPFFTTLNDDNTQLGSTSGNPSLAFRNTPPDTPTGLTIEKSEQIPKSRLLISWEACSHCDGYILERSTDENNYIEIGQFNANNTETRDDNLLDETTYYYRLYTYNELGNSSYSETISGKTGEPILEIGTSQNFTLYPNPTTDFIQLSEAFERIDIYSLSGMKLISSTDSAQIDLSQLQAGVYILRIKDGQSTTAIKVIKQ